ncbi:MAG: nicotinate-nucleotide--dimethylbenzimidazole phosphoribosyltransferase [Marinifilaceae bacterium]|jgi:nicotinate-nucleotide--dimethylbenzimidazole phosphoribosyltransferase|nr:nicotinate-nucleotide--dimethylbenzimidazole phosphoribosyltransferase [Marinifilaceae bacterium]
MEEKIQYKIDHKTKPKGSLGILEELGKKICLLQNTLSPEINNPTMLVFAADHGLADEGVSSCPKEMTYQMVKNFVKGGAAINVFCKQNGFNIRVVDAGVDYDFDKDLDIIHTKLGYGTKNILHEPAMTKDLCKKAMQIAAEIVREEHRKGSNLLAVGEMGIGNTSNSSLIMNKIIGTDIADCVGVGAGHTSDGYKHKLDILTRASKLYDVNEPIDVLATYGGFEIAMMCGAMLEAKELGMIVLVDGFICTAAFLVAYELNKSILKNTIFCHKSEEKGHQIMLDYLGVEGLVDLKFRLGEGTGSAVALPLIQASVNFINQMSSFEEAEVFCTA